MQIHPAAHDSIHGPDLSEETIMPTKQSATIAKRAIFDIDHLLNSYDHGAQIESALPLLLRHRRTLALLCGDPSVVFKLPRIELADERWVDDLVTTYKQLGGKAPHLLVYRGMEKLRRVAGRSWPFNAHEAIRQTLQAHNAESPQYHGGDDLFRMVRRGLWRLRS